MFDSNDKFCYLTTIGRVTEQPHRVEMWFAFQGEVLYCLSGARERSDWVKNLMKNPHLTVQIGHRIFRGSARFIEGQTEDPIARELLVEKYGDGADSLSEWKRRSLPIAIDLEWPGRSLS